MLKRDSGNKCNNSRRGGNARACAGVIFATTLLFGSPAVASDQNASALIDGTLRKLEGLIERGVSAEELTRQMYNSNPIVTGYGVPKPRMGLAAETVAIDGFLKSLAPPGHRNCKFSIVEPATVSPAVIAAFTNLACRGNKATSQELDQKYHVLYVWQKVGQTWRVALEMFGSGFL